MPAILPIILASHLVLAADRVPQFNIEPTCHNVAQTSPGLNRDENSCKRQEQAAHDKLNQDWDKYTQAQRDHCARLSTLGGSPSYVELATCLDIDKAAKNLPDTEQNKLKTTGQTPVENGGVAGRLNRR